MDIGKAGELKEQIRLAIGVHGMWKTRINSAAQTGMSEWKPELVESGHNCDFGKWLDSFPEAGKGAEYKKVFSIHADFHKEAARVLKMALNGQRAEALKAMAVGGAYDTLTTSLTRAMMEWRDKP